MGFMVGPINYFFNAGEIATEIPSLIPSLFFATSKVGTEFFRRYSVANTPIVTE